MGFQNTYKLFAPYYREIAEDRKHFQKQTKLVKNIISRFGLEEPKILDAACGTGDVVAALIRSGRDASGTDGSKGMLEQVRYHPSLRRTEILLQHWLWQDLDILFVKHKFDLIFILGNSLAHANKKDIPKIFANIRRGLKKGGVFAFDFRRWARDPKGKMSEPGRKVKRLGQFKVDGRSFLVYDECHYKNGIQFITYSIKHRSQKYKSLDTNFTVRYTPFDETDARTWLREAGFENYSISFRLYGSWPYLVAVAKAT